MAHRNGSAALLAICLLLAAGLAYGGGEGGKGTYTTVRGTVAALDAAQGTIQMTPFKGKEGEAAQTVVVPPTANLYRVTQVQPSDVKVGDTLVVRSRPTKGTKSPLPLLSATGQVASLGPLALKVSDHVTVTIRDTADLYLQRWTKITLAQVAVGDRVNVIAQEAEGRLTCSWAQVSPAAPVKEKKEKTKEK